MGDSNPMVGCEGRASLMGGLGRTLLLSPDIYTRNGTTRFGNILDFILEKAGGRIYYIIYTTLIVGGREQCGS